MRDRRRDDNALGGPLNDISPAGKERGASGLSVVQNAAAAQATAGGMFYRDVALLRYRKGYVQVLSDNEFMATFLKR